LIAPKHMTSLIELIGMLVMFIWVTL